MKDGVTSISIPREPKEKMKDNPKNYGEEVGEELHVGPAKIGNIWKERDFRINVGPELKKGSCKLKRGARSTAAKKLKKGRRGCLPDRDTWQRDILY